MVQKSGRETFIYVLNIVRTCIDMEDDSIFNYSTMFDINKFLGVLDSKFEMVSDSALLDILSTPDAEHIKRRRLQEWKNEFYQEYVLFLLAASAKGVKLGLSIQEFSSLQQVVEQDESSRKTSM